jgi:hypothetical protein
VLVAVLTEIVEALTDEAISIGSVGMSGPALYNSIKSFYEPDQYRKGVFSVLNFTNKLRKPVGTVLNGEANIYDKAIVFPGQSTEIP